MARSSAPSGHHFAGPKKVEATRGKELSGGTLENYMTVDDLISRRRKKEVAATVAAQTKEREAVEKQAQRLQDKLQRDAEKEQKGIKIEARKNELDALQEANRLGASERKRKRNGSTASRKVAGPYLQDLTPVLTGGEKSDHDESSAAGGFLVLATEKGTFPN